MSPRHLLWRRPYKSPTPDEIAQARVIPVGPEPVEVVPPDPQWPTEFRRVAARIRTVLGDRLVYDIYERILAADPAHEHAPQPRPI